MIIVLLKEREMCQQRQCGEGEVLGGDTIIQTQQMNIDARGLDKKVENRLRFSPLCGCWLWEA